MSIKSKVEEAEATLDSAEMLLESMPGGGKTRRELKSKVRALEQEIQEPDSESSLDSLISDVRDLITEMEDEDVDPGMMEDEMNDIPPEDNIPPM